MDLPWRRLAARTTSLHPMGRRFVRKCFPTLPAMLRSLRFAGLSEDLADDVGLYKALDLDIDEIPDDIGEQKPVEALVMDLTAEDHTETAQLEEAASASAAATPPLQLSSSSWEPIPGPGEPTSSDDHQARRGEDS